MVTVRTATRADAPAIARILSEAFRDDPAWSVTLPEDQTHDCLFHSLTTCLGEMAGEPVDITVTDEAGQTVLDETRTAYDNGFVGLWLPRDLTGTLTVEHDGKSSTVPIATGDDDLTCLTTAHLT